MNLRNRSLLLLGLVFSSLFIVIAGVSLTVTMTGLDRLEYTDMNETLGQVTSSLHAESSSLLSTVQDWGWWDETAAYAVSHDSTYIESNVNPDSLGTIKVNLFMIQDPEGNLVYGRLLTADFQKDAPLTGEITGAIRNSSALTNLTAGDDGTSGLLVLPGGPMIVASTPILLSNRSGPALGTLVMGRYIGGEPLRRVQAATGYDVALFWDTRQGVGGGTFEGMERRLAGTPLVLVPDNESRIMGFSTLYDLAGRPLILGVTAQREIYHTGLSNTYTYLSLLILWAIVSALIVVFVIDRTLLRRIDALTTRVRTLPEASGDIPVPVLTGNDELAALEKSILASRADLLMSERQLRVFINALPDPAALYGRDGTILLANKAMAAYLGRSLGDLTGTLIGDHLPREELDVHLLHAREAIRRKVTVQYEAEYGGKTLLFLHYPVLDSHGEVIQIGLVSFDISERKRLENALQKVTKKIALLNTVIFKDIQSRVFVQRGYHELLLKEMADPRAREYLGRLETSVKGIQSSLEFARQYNDMGVNPPRWQQVSRVMVFAISHLDLGTLRRDFRLEGLEVYADALLERVFFNIVENVVRHARTATFLRVGYTVTEEGAVIVFEDDGPGVPADARERIFEKGAETGGPVGLFLSREILSITGIVIRETGEPGRGARFELVVPPGTYRLNGPEWS